MSAEPLAPPKTKAAGLDTRAALETTPPANHIPLADLVQLNLDGQRRASNFLFELAKECDVKFDPDALFMELCAIASFTNMQERVVMRGFARILQKHLDRGQA